MKKILLSAAVVLAAFSAANALSANVVNTHTITVPQVLSITTVPASPSDQATTLTVGQLANGRDLPSVNYNIKSNGYFNVDEDFSFSMTATSPTPDAGLNNSINAFAAAYGTSSVDGGPYYALTPVTGGAPGTLSGHVTALTGVAPTSTSGLPLSLYSHINALNYDAVPGVYSVALTVTVTQP